jgi:phage/plasmid-associated DNA primase
VGWPLSHTLFLLSNRKPWITQDPALWRRLLLVPFEIGYADDPTQPHPKPIDSDLPTKLRLETKGIMIQMILGLLGYLALGG